MLDISGLIDISIENNNLNIDISNNSTITIGGESFTFDISSSTPLLQITTGNGVVIDVSGENGGNACCIL
jgi:hypothetical protein